MEKLYSEEEVWKPITGFEGYYEVSSHGRLRSVDRIRTYVWKGKTVNRTFKGKVLSPKYDKDGYESYCLTGENGRADVRGHREVAKAFIPNPEHLPFVDHINGVKDCNRYQNLQWVTSAQNTIKYYSVEAGNGRTLSCLSKYEWLYIKYLYLEGLSYAAIKENMQLTIKRHDSIWEGLSGRKYRSITGFERQEATPRKNPQLKLDLETAENIIYKRKINEVSLKELSQEYGIAESLISRICKGKRYHYALKNFNNKYKTLEGKSK